MYKPDPLPPEPLAGTMPRADEFPGSGFGPGDKIDHDALNAYAVLVGWHLRFVPVLQFVRPGEEGYDELTTIGETALRRLLLEG